ncbi:GGDEF domain-containing protein [Thalassotalea euphylliae]|uniref:diguanylate cyclase n=1 Tax=Thalassotalea euphylliae TaxID=1655234 RepID=A0A3E0TPI7_9GAMM|nr:GGDEF domain-containing protein [Thalassotalea euphylliae]REL25895.1 GGDEF domain-containing protein [Thalassotalea euphylliae]
MLLVTQALNVQVMPTKRVQLARALARLASKLNHACRPWLPKMASCAPVFVFLLLSVLLSVLLSAFYAPHSQAMPIPQEQVSEMPVSEQLLTLVRAVEAKQVKDDAALVQSIKPIATINDAERLLLHYVRGVVALQNKRFENSVKALEQANALSTSLPESMQNSAPFYHYHQALSDAYVGLDNYQQGYHHRRTYLIKFAEEFERNEQQQLAQLEEKYQINQREQVNLLLAEQSKLKQAEVAGIELKKQEQERYAIILLCICIVFVLMIIRQLQIRRKLKWLAKTDALTGLSNRAHLYKVARKMIKRAKRHRQPLSALVIDVDQLKQINSECGYDCGNAVLQEVSRLGQEVMRSRDIFAHFEAEEFIAVLPEADAVAAQAIANNFAAKIAAQPLQIAERTIAISVSIGIASLTEQIDSVDSLIKSADDAMYLAKQAGSGQVMSFNAPSSIVATNS